METNEMEIHKRYMAYRVMRIVGLVIGGIIIAVFLAFVFGYFVMLLWNWLMPMLFSLPEISYWHAFGIILLARLLFGGHSHDHKDKSSSKGKSKFVNWVKYGKCAPKTSNGHKWTNWEHYDKWWCEEGEKGFKDYVEKRQGDHGKETGQ